MTNEFARITLSNVRLSNGRFFPRAGFWLSRNIESNERFLQFRPSLDPNLAGLAGFSDDFTIYHAPDGSDVDVSTLFHTSGEARDFVVSILGGGAELLQDAIVVLLNSATFDKAALIQTLQDLRAAVLATPAFPSPIPDLSCDFYDLPGTACNESPAMFDADDQISAIAARFVHDPSDATFAVLAGGFLAWARADSLMHWVGYTGVPPQADTKFKYITNNGFTLTLLNTWSLIRDDPRMQPDDAMIVHQWLDRLSARFAEPEKANLGNPPPTNNHGYLTASVATARGILFADDAAFRQGITFFALALKQMRLDGSLPYEVERQACAVRYHNTAIGNLVSIAAMAQTQGYDLYRVTDNGRSLDRAVRFLLDAIADASVAAKYSAAGTNCNLAPDSPMEPVTAHDFPGRYALYSQSAWVEAYLRRFPRHPRVRELESVISGGLKTARPARSPWFGGNLTCFVAPVPLPLVPRRIHTTTVE